MMCFWSSWCNLLRSVTKSHVLHACRSKIMLGMNCEVQMVALVGKEGCNSGGSTGCIVIGKFGKRKQLAPIVLLVIAVDSDVLL